MARNKSKEKGTDTFPTHIYAGFCDDVALFMYGSLEELRDANDLAEGQQIAIYELKRIGKLSFGVTEVK